MQSMLSVKGGKPIKLEHCEASELSEFVRSGVGKGGVRWVAIWDIDDVSSRLYPTRNGSASSRQEPRADVNEAGWLISNKESDGVMLADLDVGEGTLEHPGVLSTNEAAKDAVLGTNNTSFVRGTTLGDVGISSWKVSVTGSKLLA